MSKRKGDSLGEDSKRIKLLNEIGEPFSSSKLIHLSIDDISIILEYLNIGEVIVFSLSCQHIYKCVKEQVKMVHPYVVNFEWSIGRAFKIYRNLEVEKQLIDQLNDIFDSMIEKKEPFSKLTKCVTLSNELDLAQVLNLFSKQTGQPQENVKYLKLDKKVEPLDDSEHAYQSDDENEDEEIFVITRDLKSIPIGFLVKNLIINASVSLSKLYRILVNFNSLEKLRVAVISEGFNLFTDEVPLLENLKHLELYTGKCSAEIKIARNLLKLAPNLEYLRMVYSRTPADDEFLLYIAQSCPKLKGIHIDTNFRNKDDNYLEFSENSLLKFLERVPNLEYLKISHHKILVGEGKLFSKIGQFKKLRYLSFKSKKTEEEMDEYVFSSTDLEFGGGVLDKLQHFQCDSFAFHHFTESEKYNLIKSLTEMAPNIEDIGDSFDIVHGIEIFDYADLLSPLLTIFPPHTPYHQIDPKKIEYWLKKAKKLEEIVWAFPLCDLSNIEPIPSVKSLFVKEDKRLRELSRVFPSVTELFYEDNEEELIEILKEGVWPDLNILDGEFPESILQIRPTLCEIEDQFVKEWLIFDEIEEKKKISKMIAFLNK